MSRYISWLAVGVAAAFLVVASASFSLGATAWLAFAIAIGTLVVSAGIANQSSSSAVSVYTAVLIALISAWTIVASLVFSHSTVQHLALASSLAISGLTLVGLTTHEVEQEHALHSVKDRSTGMESSTGRAEPLAPAA
jgi:ABC-type nickel/cobalt efflux system permease component RcnA